MSAGNVSVHYTCALVQVLMIVIVIYNCDIVVIFVIFVIILTVTVIVKYQQPIPPSH